MIRRIGDNEAIVADGYDWTRLLKDNKESPTVFHGTSSVLLTSVLANGLDLRFCPVSPEDLRLFEYFGEKYGIFGPALRKSYPFSITLSLAMAEHYARAGPEIIRRLLLNSESHLFSEDKRISTEDRNEILRLHEKYKKIMEEIKRSTPVVLVIQTPFTLGAISGSHPSKQLLENEAVLKEAVSVASGLRPGLDDVADPMGIPPELERVYVHRKYSPYLSAPQIIEIAVRASNYEIRKDRVPPEEIIGVISVSPRKGMKVKVLTTPQLLETSL